MTADDLIDRPDNTTPFIGRPRRQLINSDAFQTACALPELDRYEELAVSLAAGLRRAIDEHASGNGGTA